ncbi:hypothetical protein SynROS8604_01154 [Synechococcus sp. ROS8604]|nr:hypothetical protein SynROS8604_01154 [Synechococcus sp. ROS8604]
MKTAPFCQQKRRKKPIRKAKNPPINRRILTQPSAIAINTT